MDEPEKPFACTIPDCGMTFTNEDHLNVHTKKHDMVLQFGSEQKAAFVADQTPTPTRFIRNCEEVGLFQDLQSVNPFDEGFKRAMESKQGMLSLDTTPSSTDDLHTPQMVFPLDPGDCVYSTNNQRNITISRSSSDESGAIKEFETTTISKLTNQVTTISRVVEKHDELTKTDDKTTKNNVSYTNNVIKIQSNVEITKNIEKNDEKICEKPLMSQKSIDFVVDSLTSDFEKPKKEEYEVIIKLPSGQQIKLTSDEKEKDKKQPKDLLRKLLTDKVQSKSNKTKIPVIPVPGGTLIPVSIINANIVPKIPLKYDKKPVKRKAEINLLGKNTNSIKNTCSSVKNTDNIVKNTGNTVNNTGNTVKSTGNTDKFTGNTSKSNVYDKKTLLDSRCAASRRYRQRLKETWSKQADELRELREQNDRLLAEKAVLQNIIVKHIKKCPNADDLHYCEFITSANNL